uniref:Uncharacterized protein n=1 Tax=Eutreptiella gymnastica TaxID=73025 RepID=A0A7S1NVK2_9EUGL
MLASSTDRFPGFHAGAVHKTEELAHNKRWKWIQHPPVLGQHVYTVSWPLVWTVVGVDRPPTDPPPTCNRGCQQHIPSFNGSEYISDHGVAQIQGWRVPT